MRLQAASTSVLSAFDGAIQHQHAARAQIGQRPDRRARRAAGAEDQGRLDRRVDLGLPHPARQAARVGVAAEESPVLD